MRVWWWPLLCCVTVAVGEPVADDCFWLRLLPPVRGQGKRPPDEHHRAPWEPVMVDGKVVGERLYDDATGRRTSEYGLDEAGSYHGISRGWHPNGRRRSFSTCRHGLLEGPAVVWTEDGRVRKQMLWFLADQQVSLEAYQAALARDPTLPPYDLVEHLDDEPKPVKIGPPVAGPPVVALPVELCWSPSQDFSAAGMVPAAPYGTRALVARLTYPRLPADADVRVVWTLAGQAEPLLVQTARLAAAGAVFEAAATAAAGTVFLPGTYAAEMTIDGLGTGRGSLPVAAPQSLANRPPAEVYAAALEDVAAALQAFQQGDLPGAATAAERGLGPVQGVLAAAPELVDVQVVWELLQALSAIGQVTVASQTVRQDEALDWAARAVGHARYVAEHGTEALFQRAGQELVEALAPQLKR